MKSAEVITVYTSYEDEGQTYELWSLEHPEGVECVFVDSQCACGRLDIGVKGFTVNTRYWEVGEE